MTDSSTVAFVYCAIALICSGVMLQHAHVLTKITSKYSVARYVFYAYIFVGLAGIFDCAYILRESGTVSFPQPVSYVLTLLYVICSTLSGILWVCYSEKVQNSWFARDKKRFMIYMAPLVLTIPIILSTPFTHWYFYFDGIHYERGPLFLIASSLIFIYIFGTGIFALVNSRRKEHYADRFELMRIFEFSVVSFLIQFVQLLLPPVFPYRTVGIMLIYGFFLQQIMIERIGVDALTHLNNRYTIDSYLASLFAGGKDFEVVLLDGDKFKSINDTYGHAEGDKALIDISEAMKASAGKSCFVSRIGGDEFLIINTDLNNSISDIEEHLNESLSSIGQKRNAGYTLTVSAGFAVKDQTVMTIPDLIELADTKCKCQ